MRLRAVILYFLLVAGGSMFFTYMNMAHQSDHDQDVPAGSPGSPASPVIDRQPDLTPTLMTIEGQPAAWDTQSMTLAEQVQRQADWLRPTSGEVPHDENLVTESHLTGSGTPYPSGNNEVLDERGLLLRERNWDGESVIRRWDPHTGEMQAALILRDVVVLRGIATRSGLVLLVREEVGRGLVEDSAVFVDHDGRTALIRLTEVRDDPHVLVLPDDSVLIVGGKDPLSDVRLRTVERLVMAAGYFDVERLPDLPGPASWGYSVVALADGRLMMAGGSTSQYTGCREPECSRKTWTLDPATAVWAEGPALNEPRAAATASLLADGSVMIAGGWTADRAENARRSRSSERLRPGSSRFENDAQLPVAMAGHRAVSLSENGSSPYVLVDERTNTLVAYELEQNEWRVVAGYPTYSQFQLGPFSDGQEHFFWASESTGGGWTRQEIRIGGQSAAIPSPETSTVLLHRSSTGYLPGEAGTPAVIVGGYVGNARGVTMAVDSYSDEDGLQPLSPVPSARYNAQVFRIGRGSIAVAGGINEYRDSRASDTDPVTIELLPRAATGQRWTTLDVTHPPRTRYAQIGQNELVALLPGQAVELLTFEGASSEEPRVRRSHWPDRPAHRQSGEQPEETVMARGLSDGRLVVAGGFTHYRKIAIYQEATDVPDEYVGIGNLILADTYEIFDALTQRWITSAPSIERGGQVAILADGRVAKLHIRTQQSGTPAGHSFFIEISRPDGGGWSPIVSPKDVGVNPHSTRLTAVGSDLFLAGLYADDELEEYRRVLHWYDAAEEEWIAVWRERDSRINTRNQDVIARVRVDNDREVLVPVGGT